MASSLTHAANVQKNTIKVKEIPSDLCGFFHSCTFNATPKQQIQLPLVPSVIAAAFSSVLFMPAASPLSLRIPVSFLRNSAVTSRACWLSFTTRGVIVMMSSRRVLVSLFAPNNAPTTGMSESSGKPEEPAFLSSLMSPPKPSCRQIAPPRLSVPSAC